MTERINIDNPLIYFSNIRPFNYEGSRIMSPYGYLLKRARNLTGRYLSGEKNPKKGHGSWEGALLHLILIDHIAIIVSNCKDKNLKRYEPVINYLYPIKLSEEDLHTIYALRCSLAHNFILYNHNKKDKNYNRVFILTQGTSRLIVNSEKVWDGDQENRNTKEYQSIIDLECLSDLVEKMHTELINKCEKGEILTEKLHYIKLPN